MNSESLSIMLKYAAGMLIILAIVFLLAILTPKLAKLISPLLPEQYRKLDDPNLPDKTSRLTGKYMEAARQAESARLEEERKQGGLETEEEDQASSLLKKQTGETPENFLPEKTETLSSDGEKSEKQTEAYQEYTVRGIYDAQLSANEADKCDEPAERTEKNGEE